MFCRVVSISQPDLQCSKRYTCSVVLTDEHVFRLPFSQEQDIAFPKDASFNLSEDTSDGQCQRAEELLSILQYLLQRLLTTSKTDGDCVDNGIDESGYSEVVHMTRTLFKKKLSELDNSNAERNRSVVIAEMTDKLEAFQQHFTRAVLPYTREFKNILAALGCKQSYLSDDFVRIPIKELIQQELILFNDIQRALNNLNVLLIHTSTKGFFSITSSLTSSTGFETATEIHEECQRAISTIAMLISELNSMLCHEPMTPTSSLKCYSC